MTDKQTLLDQPTDEQVEAVAMAIFDNRYQSLNERARAAISTIQPPEGYVMVPVEPTEAMMFAGSDAETSTELEKPPAFRSRIVYKAMIAASPTKAEGKNDA